MKKKLKSMVKIVILFFILTGILFAGDVQDDLTDTSLQNTYGIKDGGVISASNLRTLFMKLASGAWSSNGSSIYYDKGNVGIGTDNPESTLHVRNASGNCEIKFQYGVGNRGLLGAYANKVSLFLLGSEISDGNDGILHIKSGGDNIVFDGNDNVGIGTISPTEKLSIVGSMIQDDVTTMRFLRLGLDSNAGYGLSLGYGYFTSPYSFASVLQSLDNNIGTNLLLNPSGGNVGIGTTDPKTKLDVNGTLYLRKND
ncbi:MAG TPA: hypothetical protein DHW82_02750, partial [Spirochaetia bacterium]|nr:hypothetical protein [Spirochaetia bacterium]